jgi:transposase
LALPSEEGTIMRRLEEHSDTEACRDRVEAARTRRRFVGVDLHKRILEVCILDADGRVVLRHRLELTRERLTSFARDYLTPDDLVAVEATTNTWAVVRLLKPFVAGVVVSNPLKTRAIAEAKVKTDKVDAHVLAQLLRCDFLPGVWQPDEATEGVRRLTARRARLVGQQTAIKNRLHAILAERLIDVPYKTLFSKAGVAWLRGLELDQQGRGWVDSDLRLLESLDREIEACEVELVRGGYDDARVRLLMTLPGVDIHVAQVLVATLGDVTRFPDPDHAASYLGLVPSTRQSADRCYHGPITKAGRGQARCMVVQAAQHLDRHPGPLGVFFRNLARRKGRNVAVVATARKLVTIAWHMLSRNEPYRYATPGPTEAKLRRLRVRATGERRKTGPEEGTQGTARLGVGTRSRTVKPLAEVYRQEGLPATRPPSDGERRMLEASGTAGFVDALQAKQVVAKKRPDQPTGQGRAPVSR